jgi:O-acetyl-ADP-ribose deacetylase (regulator of RNase III)
VSTALRKLRRLIEQEGFDSLALPRLATGVGGLGWDEVRPLLEKNLGDLDIPIFLYTVYRAGEAGEH